MDGFDPAASAPYEIRRAGKPGGLVFACPHSGRIYPTEMMAASALDSAAIRSSEDAFVDDLISGGVDHGAHLLVNRYARAFVDVNRQAYELDPSMFEDALPAFAAGKGPRIAAGLGAVPRIVADGQEIYSRKLTFAEAEDRLEAVHTPYHTALRALIDEARRSAGRAIVIDWHSMPSAAGRSLRTGKLDFVLGDRFGRACDPALPALIEAALREEGYSVGRNNPYAGGYTTEHYGRPEEGVHVLQIEIDRGLYLDEQAVQPSAGYADLKAALNRLFATVAEGSAAI